MSTTPIKPQRKQWLTVANAALFADCSQKTIRRLVATGDLEATYLTPRAMRISRASLENLLQANSTNQWAGGAA